MAAQSVGQVIDPNAQSVGRVSGVATQVVGREAAGWFGSPHFFLPTPGQICGLPCFYGVLLTMLI